MNTTITSSATNFAMTMTLSSQTGLGGAAAGSTISGDTHNVSQNVSTVTATPNEPSKVQLNALVNEGNAFFQNISSNLEFQVDDSTDQLVVRIVNSDTGELVRQIPTVEMLAFIRAMKELEGNIGKLYSNKT